MNRQAVALRRLFSQSSREYEKATVKDFLEIKNKLGGRRHDSVKIRELSYEMLAKLNDMKSKGAIVDRKCYAVVVEFLAVHNQKKIANNLLTNLREDNIVFNKELYEAAIMLAVKERDSELIMTYLAEMKTLRIRVSSTLFREILSVVKLPRALEVLSHMKQNRWLPSITHYNAMAGCLSNLSQAPLVLKLISERGLVPDSETFNNLIAVSHDPAKADKLFEVMTKRKLVNKKTYIVLANVHKAVGDYESVVEIFTNMTKAGHQHSAVSYGILLKTIALSDKTHQQKLEEAETIFASALSNGHASEILYIRMMEVLRLCNARRRATDLISDMKGNGLRIHPGVKQEYDSMW
eukprot:TRINITY_DN15918_c0_g1_i1.p1 TRINITY_DN15918_c0_g1~~TRINITY_DN15918_c0_g1_i1.p1  ORF type:complete len:351 (+),score=38.81 TRINITY_DN15918_c0_g1_i1:52-1104(+)